MLLHRSVTSGSFQLPALSISSTTVPSITTQGAPSTKQQSKQSQGVAVLTTTTKILQPRSILLATATLCIITDHHYRTTVRALIDACSEASFITENLAQRLRLSRQSKFVLVLGVGAALSYTASSAAAFEISPRLDDTKHFGVRALIIPKLTEYLPPPRSVKSTLSFVRDLCLADPQIRSPDDIEMILGADVFTLIIQEGLRRSPDGDLISRSTSLG